VRVRVRGSPVPSRAVPKELVRSFFSLLFLLSASVIESLPLSLSLHPSFSLSLSFILPLSFSSALSISLSVCTRSREVDAAFALFLSLFELVITAEGAMVVVEFLRDQGERDKMRYMELRWSERAS
jgi:hypothetical protein